MTREEFCSIPLTELRIRILKQSIASLRSLATSLSAPLGGDRVQSSGVSDRVGRIVADIADAEAEMEKEIRRLAQLRLEAIQLVEGLPDPDQSVMRLRYIVGAQWETIADEIGYTERNCYLIHNRAMRKLFNDYGGKDYE